MTKEVPLTKGYTALVDDEDYEWICGFKWHSKNRYAATTFRVGPDRTNCTVHMHDFICLGHALTGTTNLYIAPSGHRKCRACDAARHAASYQRRKTLPLRDQRMEAERE